MEKLLTIYDTCHYNFVQENFLVKSLKILLLNVGTRLSLTPKNSTNAAGLMRAKDQSKACLEGGVSKSNTAPYREQKLPTFRKPWIDRKNNSKTLSPGSIVKTKRDLFENRIVDVKLWRWRTEDRKLLFNRNEAYSRYKNSDNHDANGKRGEGVNITNCHEPTENLPWLLLKWTKLFIHRGTKLFLEISTAWLELPACNSLLRLAVVLETLL